MQYYTHRMFTKVTYILVLSSILFLTLNWAGINLDTTRDSRDCLRLLISMERGYWGLLVGVNILFDETIL